MDHEDHHPFYPRRYSVNNKIMLAVIICLFVVTLLVVLLYIYARCILRRRARRHATIHHLTIGAASAQVNSREPPKTGLDPSVIAALPIFAYKQAHEHDEAAAVECTVCLSTLQEGELARLLPNCKHMFHVQCIDMWLNSQSTCPVCRTGVEPRALPEAHEVGAGVIQMGPSLDSLNCTTHSAEGTSDGAAQSPKVGGSGSRLSSFRRMLSRDRSERRVQPCGQADGVEDLER